MESYETWKPIPGYEGYYEASNLGRVRSLDRQTGQKFTRGRVLSPSGDGVGYTSFSLCRGNEKMRIKTHRAVCAAFHGRPKILALEVRHLNGVPSDNRANNLAWGTAKENRADAVRHGTTTFGEKNRHAKLNSSKVMEIHHLSNLGATKEHMARRFGVCVATIQNILVGRTWRHIQRDC